MANYRIPRKARRVVDLAAPDADGATIRLRVYSHVRAGYDPSLPDFYLVQYRETPGGKVVPGTRYTRRFAGANGRARLDAALASPREQFAEACAHAAMTRSGAWMAAGSPAHEFEPGFGDWCAQCGCGAPGEQHHRATVAS